MTIAAHERIRRAVSADEPALRALAAETFPDACPPWASEDVIAAHIAREFTPERIGAWIDDASSIVLVAESADAGGAVELQGYALVRLGPPMLDEARQQLDDPDRSAEISKCYVRASERGSGLSSALLEAAINDASEAGMRVAWLAVDVENERAQRFYAKHGFERSGSVTFWLGEIEQHDHLLVRPLT